MSEVSSVKVNEVSTNPQIIFRAVKKAMELINWENRVKKGNIVLKINAVWDHLYPSCTTSPMVIEGILKVILASKKVRPSNIAIADTDTAAIMSADKSFRIQGIEALAKKYGVQLANLTNTEFEEIKFKGLVLKELKISRLILSADNIITVPVLKTHSYSGMTGGLKNQWGCIHDLRHNYHLVLHKAIVDVNIFLKEKISFCLMDALFGMDGKGPKAGRPRKVGYIFASTDLVSLDSAAASVMGFSPQDFKYITFAQEEGLGSTKFNVLGDPLPSFNFLPATNANIVMKSEIWFRRLGPRVEWLMFNPKSPILFILKWLAKIYYDLWYLFIGQKIASKMLQTNYGCIWSKRYLKALSSTNSAHHRILPKLKIGTNHSV